ncbi:MAG: cobalt-precorrin-5B (C(1))-methyltransferase, partial [Anaerovoracaceae bacterium]
MKHMTGIESHYIIKNNKKLRFGYTTGTCAAAASKAAAMMLLLDEPFDCGEIKTPK